MRDKYTPQNGARLMTEARGVTLNILAACVIALFIAVAVMA